MPRLTSQVSGRSIESFRKGEQVFIPGRGMCVVSEVLVNNEAERDMIPGSRVGDPFLPPPRQPFVCVENGWTSIWWEDVYRNGELIPSEPVRSEIMGTGRYFDAAPTLIELDMKPDEVTVCHA